MTDNTPAVAGAIQEMQKRFTAAADKAPESTFLPILKFTRRGDWVLGKDADEVTEGTVVVLRTDSIREGWLGWQNGKVVGEKMQPVSGADVNDIPREDIVKVTKKDGWALQYSVEGKLKTGHPAFVYKTTTHGGKTAMTTLIQQISQQFRVNQQYINPVIELNVDSYVHPEYGETFTPELDIIDWMAIDSTDLLSEKPEDQIEYTMGEGQELL